MKVEIINSVVAGLIFSVWLLASVPASCADDGGWTLKSSAQRMIEIVPELRTADAEIAVRAPIW